MNGTNWYISTIDWSREGVNEILIITGFRFEGNITLYTTITKTDIVTAFSKQQVYHEGVSLSFVSPSEVYIIDIVTAIDVNEVNRMKTKPFVSVENSKFNDIIYMGLPLQIFATWKGLINTDL